MTKRLGTNADVYESPMKWIQKWENAFANARAFFMGSVQGEGRTRGTSFPVCLEKPVSNDPMFRVMNVFVNRWDGAVL
jgi:hypothetical protein